MQYREFQKIMLEGFNREEIRTLKPYIEKLYKRASGKNMDEDEAEDIKEALLIGGQIEWKGADERIRRARRESSEIYEELSEIKLRQSVWHGI